jgi:hypothetical protein
MAEISKDSPNLQAKADEDNDPTEERVILLTGSLNKSPLLLEHMLTFFQE